MRRPIYAIALALSLAAAWPCVSVSGQSDQASALDRLAKPPDVQAPPNSKLTIDQKSQELLDKATQTAQSLKALTANYETKVYLKGGSYDETIHYGCKIQLMKPNFARVERWGDDDSKEPGKSGRKVVDIQDSDGSKNWFLWDAADNLYESSSVDKDGHNLPLYDVDFISDFFNPDKSFLAVRMPMSNRYVVKYLGPASWQGKNYETIQCEDFAVFNGMGPHGWDLLTSVLYIGDDGLIHRLVSHGNDNNGYSDGESTLTDVDTDPHLTKDDFVFNAPAGAVERSRSLGRPRPADGTIAPDFVVSGKDGASIALSDFLGKIVVLDFWSSGRGSTVGPMDRLDEVAKKYKDEGVVVLAVDSMSTKDKFAQWLKNHTDYKSILLAVDPSKFDDAIASNVYNVDSLPTLFVIGKDRKIVKSIDGFKDQTAELEAAINDALAN
jgi:thiol-disulfide isomerase/thioredoxin